MTEIRNYLNWNIDFSEEPDLKKHFAKDKLIYLTGDAKTDMEVFEEE